MEKETWAFLGLLNMTCLLYFICCIQKNPYFVRVFDAKRALYESRACKTDLFPLLILVSMKKQITISCRRTLCMGKAYCHARLLIYFIIRLPPRVLSQSPRSQASAVPCTNAKGRKSNSLPPSLRMRGNICCSQSRLLFLFPVDPRSFPPLSL